MQENFDFYSLIIVITFLGVLLFIAFYINKKKDFLKSQFNRNKPIALVNSTLLGGGNRAILFEVDKKKFLVVSSKNSISNIIPFIESTSKNFSENN